MFKKTAIRLLLLTLSLLTVLFAFSACANVEYAINFVVDGEVYDTVRTGGNEIIRMPADPAKEGYDFDGWYLDNDTWQTPFTANSLLEAPLSKNIQVYAKFTEAHVHTYGEWETVTAPTCGSKGLEHRLCAACGAEETRETEKAEHSFGEWETVTAPTCGSKGLEHRLCAACGAEETRETEMLPHTYADTWTYNDTEHWHAATCEHTDLVADKAEHEFVNGVCECGKKIVTSETYYLHHIVVTEIGTGVKSAYYVGENNLHIGDLPEEWTVISLRENGIAEVSFVDAPADGGWTKVTTQNGAYIFEYCFRKDKNHVFDQKVVEDRYFKSEATCVEGAIYYYSCACGEKGTETFVVGSGTGHSFSASWIFDETYHWHAATCEHADETSGLSAHDYEIVEIKPTCTKDGYSIYSCKECGYTYVGSKVVAVGHSFVKTSEEKPTCTEDGYIVYTCERDGCSSVKTEITLALGHSFGGDNVCDRCGYSREIHEHTYVKAVTDPTCSQMGYTTYTCDCGDSYRTDYVEPSGHSWDAGEETVKHTCTADGVITYRCLACDAFYTETVMARHEWAETVITLATCTTNGVRSKECSVCHETETEVYPASHEWTASRVIKEAGCEEDGTAEYECSVCKTTKQETIKRTGHTFRDGVCTKCGKKYSEIIITSGSSLIYGMYFKLEDVQSNYGSAIINEYGVLLDVNEGAKLDKVAVYLTQDGTMWRRAIACTGENITYATYVPYLSYDDEIYYTGLNSQWINTFRLSEDADGIWKYNDYVTIGVNLQDKDGNLLLSLYDIGQAGTKTRVFTDLDEMKQWLLGEEHVHTVVEDQEIPATCYTNGMTAGSHCSTCGEVLIARSIIPAGHTYASDWDYDVTYHWHAATCEHTDLVADKAEHTLGTDGICTVCGYDFSTSFGFTFEKIDGKDEYRVVGFTTAATQAVIPAEYNGLPVTAIGDYAFYECFGLTSVTIPSSVTTIGEGAFGYCTSLLSITIPSSVTSIGMGIFACCTNLTSITVDESNPVYHSASNCIIETASKTLIAGCGSSIIPADGSVTSIGGGAFAGCSITSITIPEGVTSIGYAAFVSTTLTSITIPSSVVTIGECALGYCERLTSITVDKNNLVYHSAGNCLIETATKTLILGCQSSIIPDDGSVTSIGDYAFWGCSSLTSVTIPSSVTSIGSSAFYECSSLTSVTFAENSKCTTIGDYAFEDCSSLTSITIPSSVTSIGFGAFWGCSNLTSVTIPSSVTTIGDYAFTGCSNLASVTFAKNSHCWWIGDWAFYNCSNLTSITISSSVTTIGYGAFYNCSSLTSVTIPSSVTSIDDCVFYGCSNLTIYCEAATKPSGWAYYWNPSNCPVVWGYQAPTEPEQGRDSAAPVISGNKVTFGSYPQSEVTDATLVATLNASAGTVKGQKPTASNANGWTSYEYYISGSNATAFMWYIDITQGGEKYRGVYFTSYRPYYTTYSTSAGNSYQDDNGYTTGTVYWFRYDPLTWTILSQSDGKALILCDYIIDSQAYQNEYEYKNGYYYIKGTDTYANNYAQSTIRQWLNDEFLHTAFTTEEIEAYILTTTVDNSARSTNPNSNATQWNSGTNSYACENTQDKIFLLSEQEVTNSAYGFSSSYSASDTARRKQNTDYAKVQGAYTSTGTSYAGNGWWWLRSPYYYNSYYARDVYFDGNVYNGNFNVGSTIRGVVPALQISVGYQAPTEPEPTEPERESAEPVISGNKVTFGSYPQTEVTDATLVATLNAAAGTVKGQKPSARHALGWTSYEYYISGSNATAFMWYIDITQGGEKYRGVYFTSYRPYWTDDSSSASNSYQDNNGYTTGTVYWFRYDPLTWTILSQADGKALILCDYIIDSQAYQNEYEYKNGAYYIKGTDTYFNNYAQSMIRQWLNDEFLHTAFTTEEIEEYILTTTVDNSARSTNPNSNATQLNSGVNNYACENTQDKIFLLSEQEVTNSAYGFSSDYLAYDTARRKQNTDYAKVQGASTNTSTDYAGNGTWWLRSPTYYYSNYALGVNYDGNANSGSRVSYTPRGVVPALQISVG